MSEFHLSEKLSCRFVIVERCWRLVIEPTSCVTNRLFVELKAIECMTSREESQLLNYLNASRKEKGLLLNFGSRSLEYKRMVRALNLRESA